MRTQIAKPGTFQQQWLLIDAEGQALGRMSTLIANILRGKVKPIFTPNIDTGDYVVVINAAKVRVTGSKENQKVYKHYTGYPGGLRETPYKTMLATKPEEIIIRAVKGMMPKNVLGRQMLKKLFVYSGAVHPHGAQKPRPYVKESN